MNFVAKKMIHRIVRMVFKPEYSEEFNEYVKTIVEKIASSEGCSKVEILRDKDDSNVFFTCSFWRNENDLLNYKNSELFKNVWYKTKRMFAQRALAWSTELVSEAKR